MTSYYDLVLALIPLTLVGATAVLLGVGLSLTAAVPVGASLSVLLIGHAMFVRSPAGRSSVPTTDATAGGIGDLAAD